MFLLTQFSRYFSSSLTPLDLPALKRKASKKAVQRLYFMVFDYLSKGRQRIVHVAEELIKKEAAAFVAHSAINLGERTHQHGHT